MNEQCIREVLNAAGRKLTEKEIKAIFDNINNAKKRLATDNPDGWMGLSEQEKNWRAAEYAADEIESLAQLKKRRAVLQIAAQDRAETYLAQNKDKLGAIETLSRMVAFKADQKSNFFSVETRAEATRDFAISQLLDTFDVTKGKLGLFEDKQGVRDLTYEIFGFDTGNAQAKMGAKAWEKVTELLRKQYNSAGGNIGHIENWGIPQHHSQIKVAKAGKEQWISDVIDKLDRNKYVNEDGSYMGDSQVRDFLEHAYDSIATGGLNKVEPTGYKVSAMRANRGSESRQIHFKDPESYMAYQQKYGEKQLWQVMVGHINSISKDIALIETFGPNPDHVFKSILDREYNKAVNETPINAGKYKNQTVKTQALYDFVSGKTEPVANVFMAQAFDTLRNLLVASKLGSAVITALADQGTLAALAKSNGLPMTKLYSNLLKALNPLNREELRLARGAGIGMDTFISTLNRLGADNLGNTWSSKLASTVIRASGLNALTSASKRAYGATMMYHIGNVTNDHATLASLNKLDLKILKSKGITEADFQIWKKAELEDWGNGNTGILTPESIMRIPNEKLKGIHEPEKARFEAARKLLGAVTEEVNMAVITPGARDRLLVGGNKQRGSKGGELWRSVFLFKSFSISMLSRHWTRGLSQETRRGKFAYISLLVASTTALGALSMQINDVISGKKPREMDNMKFWIAAMLKGGSLGLYGDFLFSEQTQQGRSPTASLLGPAIGGVEEFIGLTQGNLLKFALGEKTSFGADLIKFGKGFTPFANFWATKAATDHLIFNQAQEFMAPGYLRRMERRAKNVYGQDSWWAPSDPLPF